MKKQLMTTTALVAAGVIATSGAALGASKPKLSLGGWFEGIVGIADQEEAAVGNRVGLDVQQDSEIFFKGSVKLDNGIKITTRVELEGQSSNSSDTIDEAYMGIKGKFGEVRIGSEDNAAHLMTTGNMGSWATNVGQNLNFDVADWVEKPPGHAMSSGTNRLDLGEGDSEKLTYFTPRFAGFQVGVTYMPSANEGQNGRPEFTSSANHSGFAVATRYNGKFDSVGIGASVGYAQYNPAGDSSPNMMSDPKGWAAGLKLTFGKITVAGGYGHEMNLKSDQSTTGNDGNRNIEFGIKYDGGKNKFSLGYQTADSEATGAAGEDEFSSAMLSYRRALGPGVQYRLNLMWGDFEGEDVGSADDNDGYAITTSVRLAF